MEIRFSWIFKIKWIFKNKNEVELPARTHQSIDLIIASKGISQQIGVSAMWLHLYRPVFPSLQPSSPTPGSSLNFGLISYKQMSCPKTQQWGTRALSRLSAKASLNATFCFSAAQDVHFL